MTRVAAAITSGLLLLPLVAASASADDPGVITVTGRLVDSDGAPIGGGVRGRGGPRSDVGEDGVFSLTSNDGTFEVEARSVYSLSLAVADRPTSGAIDVGEIAVPDVVTVRLRGVMPGGAPVPARTGVRASGYLRDLVPGYDAGAGVDVVGGEYDYLTGFIGDTADVVVPSVDQVPAMDVWNSDDPDGVWWQGEVLAGTPAVDGEVTVRIVPPPVVTGRVMDARGHPVAGASVNLGYQDVTAARDGSFEFHPNTGDVRLSVVPRSGWENSPGWVRYTGPRVLWADLAPVGELTLPDLPTTTLQIVDAKGEPVYGARLGPLETIDLLDPTVAWDGVGSSLALGVPVEEARYFVDRYTRVDGRLSADLPRTMAGGLVDVPVTFNDHGTIHRSTTAAAVPRPDGSYVLTLSDLTLPVPVPVTARLRLRAGPRSEALVSRSRVGWRLRSTVPVTRIRCRANPGVSVGCRSLDAIVADLHGRPRGAITVTADTAAGQRVRWSTVVHQPRRVGAGAVGRRGWTVLPSGDARATERGSRLTLRGRGGSRIHLFARTGPGQGTVVVRVGGRVVERFDLSLWRDADRRHLTIQPPSGWSGPAELEVVSDDHPVVLDSYAFAR